MLQNENICAFVYVPQANGVSLNKKESSLNFLPTTSYLFYQGVVLEGVGVRIYTGPRWEQREEKTLLEAAQKFFPCTHLLGQSLAAPTIYHTCAGRDVLQAETWARTPCSVWKFTKEAKLILKYNTEHTGLHHNPGLIVRSKCISLF